MASVPVQSLHPAITKAATPPQRLEQLQQHGKSVKGYHIVPHDDVNTCDDDSRLCGSDLSEPLQPGGAGRRKSARSTLASSRVQRDQLLRNMEELIMQEAELASAYELFDYTRKRCTHDHDAIVAKLAHYDALLLAAQTRETELHSDGSISSLLVSESERERWRETQHMVAHTLPELLARLEDSIELNSAKIRSIQDKIDAIRAHRLALREEIALKEEDIALALQ